MKPLLLPPLMLVLGAAASASADPIRLRADALATTAAPAGLLSVEADGTQGPNLSAEAMVWTGGWSGLGTLGGALGDETHADVLVIAIRARTTDNRASGRLGRFVEALGALRPVQLDGGAGRIRLPYRMEAEAFAGVPVVAGGLTVGRTWDWVSGGRVSRKLGDMGSIGLAYLQQRTDGRLAREEVGADVGLALGKADDLGARLAYDLANPGLGEASLTASHRWKPLKVAIYSSYRSAAHILPATSLFSVLGDMPAERAGATLTWKAAPRLDVISDLAVRHAAGETAPALIARARLRLDDRGTSLLSAELRRDGVGQDTWTGARGSARIALPRALSLSTELELVIPDHAGAGLGAAWPWGLVALGWDEGPWHAAIAGEGSASPQDRHRIDVLVQLGRRWETK